MVARALRGTRPLRVLVILAAIWVLHACDLTFTLYERARAGFSELNPLAASLIDAPAPLLVAYKVVLIGLASAILLWHRERSAAEVGCWVILLIAVGVFAWWDRYYACLDIGHPGLLAAWTAAPP